MVFNGVIVLLTKKSIHDIGVKMSQINPTTNGI